MRRKDLIMRPESIIINFMLTPKQLQQLKEIENIQDPMLRQKWSAFVQLPQDLQDAIFSEEVNKKILDIGQKNGLADYQIGYLFSLMGRLFLGELPLNRFTTAIRDECFLEDEEAKNMARQIAQEILAPLKDSLQKLYGLSPEIPASRPQPPAQSIPITPTPMRPVSPMRPINSIPQSAKNEPSSFVKTTEDKRKIFVPKLDGNIVNLRDLE